jgi:Protein of unknown function (DUF3025)
MNSPLPPNGHAQNGPTPDWQALDWQAPWWRPWQAVGAAVQVRVLAGSNVHAALNAHAAALSCPVRFVSQSALPQAQAYESYIFETQTVPTRDNWHDFFNGLAWLLFPRIKTRLNAMQAAQIQVSGVQSLRGPLRDALTLFDENAVFLSHSLHAPIIQALGARDWQAAFQNHRALLAAHPPIVFGHALLEKLFSPYKAVTGHVFPAHTGHSFHIEQDLSQLDTDVAAQLSVDVLLPKPFVPLPVLGVPLWWAENESPHFYTDSTVFRPPRS